MHMTVGKPSQCLPTVFAHLESKVQTDQHSQSFLRLENAGFQEAPQKVLPEGLRQGSGI